MLEKIKIFFSTQTPHIHQQWPRMVHPTTQPPSHGSRAVFWVKDIGVDGLAPHVDTVEGEGGVGAHGGAQGIAGGEDEGCGGMEEAKEEPHGIDLVLLVW